MDKTLILAVAGSGKTTKIIQEINENDKSLIITYTENNYNILKNRIIEKFKCIPNGIKIYTYFTFLYRFCFLPLKKGFDVRGIDYNANTNRFIKSDNINFYYNKYNKKMYYNRLSKLCQNQFMKDILNRIEKYFDYIYVDEIQDFAAHDFNFLMEIIKSNCNLLLVGDFYQHTFDTSRDGNLNNKLYINYDNYIKKFTNNESSIKIDNTNFIKSKRCTKQICEFISNNLNIKIESYYNNNSEIKEITCEQEIDNIINNNEIVKLFYQNSRKFNVINCDNWGNSKGKTYINTCVILNKNSYDLYKKNKLSELPSATKNKLYVALSRASNNVYIVDELKLKKYKKVN